MKNEFLVSLESASDCVNKKSEYLLQKRLFKKKSKVEKLKIFMIHFHALDEIYKNVFFSHVILMENLILNNRKQKNLQNSR